LAGMRSVGTVRALDLAPRFWRVISKGWPLRDYAQPS
jgi:hypothetical protein